MEKISFSVTISASPEKVWTVLWQDDTYRKWTSVFSESSHAITDWKEGSKVLFIDDKGDGMVSKIETLKPNEFMSFKHLGLVKDKIEDTESEVVKAWAGAHENYTLKNVNGATDLTMEMDINAEYKEFFSEIFPKALKIVKQLAEE